MLGLNKQFSINKSRCVVLLAGLLFTLPSYADVVTSLSAQDMVNHLAEQIPNLMRFVTALAYVLGIYFIVFGLMKLKKYGEARTQMSYEQSLKGPLIFMLVGAMLIYLPSSINIATSTFWESNAFDYKLPQDEWSQFYNSVFLIVQLIGIIAFIRGLIMLTQLSGHGGHPGVFGKAMVHIIAGVFCINIFQFLQLVFATLGIYVNT